MSAEQIASGEFPPMSEKGARELMAMMIGANVAAVITKKMDVWQLKQRIAAYPDDVRQYVQIATFNEFAKVYQAGLCSFDLVKHFAPDWMPTGAKH